MKYLLLFPLVLFALWLLRRQRGRSRAQGRDQTQEQPARSTSNSMQSPTEIIECARCTVHLPRTDAVAGQHGLYYCCPAHRQDAESG